MKLLAWDTSSKAAALVALEWNSDLPPEWSQVRLVAELALNVDLAHSERLLWGVHQVLESARWKIDEVDVFGVGMGPGSFTGLRIGLTTARTLAHTLKKPLVGVSSLAALARPVALYFAQPQFSQLNPYVIATTDACKGELFALWGQAHSVAGCVRQNMNEGASLWKDGVKEQVTGPVTLIESLQEIMEKDQKIQWVAVGEGRSRYREEWIKLPSSRELAVPFAFHSLIQGRYLGQLVWEAVHQGAAEKCLDVHPQYLRASDAEQKLKAGLLGKSIKINRPGL